MPVRLNLNSPWRRGTTLPRVNTDLHNAPRRGATSSTVLGIMRFDLSPNLKTDPCCTPPGRIGLCDIVIRGQHRRAPRPRLLKLHSFGARGFKAYPYPELTHGLHIQTDLCFKLMETKSEHITKNSGTGLVIALQSHGLLRPVYSRRRSVRSRFR